jgi:hypothetical protein
MQMNLLTRPGSDLSLPTGIKSLKIDPEFHKSSLILADQSGVLTRTIHILIAVLTYTGQIYTSCQIFFSAVVKIQSNLFYVKLCHTRKVVIKYRFN